MRICTVLVTSPVDKTYDYLVPEGMDLAHGDYVMVPLGPRSVSGVVWDIPDRSDFPSSRLKTVLRKYDLPPMGMETRDFVDWVAQYNFAPRGGVLKMAISVPQGLDPPQPLTGYVLSPLSPTGRGLGEGEKMVWFQKKPPEVLIERSKSLRRQQTDVEQKLWLLLRDRRLEGYKFRRQHPFDPYILDFVCIEKNLVIELDGGQHGDRIAYDEKRDAFLNDRGLRILRFWNNEILENEEGVLTRILETLNDFSYSPSQNVSPSPNPLPVGERALRVIDVLSDGLPRRLSELAEKAEVGPSVIKTLLKHGVLEAVDLFARVPCSKPDPDFAPKNLTADQEKAVLSISDGKKDGFSPFLLDGVTGAGKTEVYFEAIAECLRAGKQALILMPEIALTNAFLTRFSARFGCPPALWHSSMTPAQRRITWRGVALGQTKVIVGARSGLFLPYADLGLIVVDEEHDTAYKQEEGIIYHARDMAVVRAHLSKIPVILTSATPSLETLQNVWDGKYTHLKLPDRFGGADKPDIKILDLRVDKPERQHFISPVLRDEMEATLAKKEQVLLFLNRRGFAPLTLCRTCGHRIECPKCTAWLVEHKRTHHLHCHHCGYSMKEPSKCPSCGDTDSLVACGPGVERIADEVKEYFPDARILVMASDVLDTHDKLTKALSDIREGRVDVIVGTQVIAKGHHFPQITCVGIIDADLGLSGGDLRATERSFQLLHQVAGRAGREHLKGHVYLQTYNAEQRVMQMLAADDRDGFLSAEAEERKRAHMPPFSRLAALVISGAKENVTQEAAAAIGRAAPSVQGVRVLGPAQAQMYRIRGKYRQRILVQADKKLNIQKMIADWLVQVKIPSSVRVTVDIDPQSFV